MQQILRKFAEPHSKCHTSVQVDHLLYAITALRPMAIFISTSAILLVAIFVAL